MQAMRKKGQWGGGEHGFGDDGSGADNWGDGLSDHVGSSQSRGMAENHWSRDRANSMVTDDAGETTRSSSSDSQNGGENSLWEK